jgi:hypothetical protein
MNTTITTAARLSTLALTGIASAASPTWEDQTLGAVYTVGDSFTSDGINVSIEPMIWSDGTSYFGGVANVIDWGWAGGTGLELNTNNCTAALDFAGSIGSQPAVQLLFGEYGGNVNLSVNGDFANVNNPIDLHGMMLGGCLVEVIAGGFGADSGRMIISGVVGKLSIGGQEFALDMTHDEGCNIDFEDLLHGTTYAPGSHFVTNGFTFGTEAFQWASGTWTTSGHIAVSATNSACGTGLELFTNNTSVRIKFDTNPVQDLRWEFGEYGGNINVAINGDFRNVPDYMALNGMSIGGCVFHVLTGGLGNDCGEVEIEGIVHQLVIGGQEHMVDCFTWNDIAVTPGDIDGDGDVDTDDLLAMLAAWGTNDPAADVNGDGIVNVDDLMILLSNY